MVVQCPSCGSQYTVSAEQARHEVKCAQCGQAYSFPAGTARDAAQRAQCAWNMRQIGMAMYCYAENHLDHLPYDPRGPLHSLVLLYPDFVIGPEAFKCPSDSEPDAFPEGCSFAGQPCSYRYVAGPTLRATGQRPVLVERQENHIGSTNVLYGDGTVRPQTGPPPGPGDYSMKWESP